jgi:hypothetical protein
LCGRGSIVQALPQSGFPAPDTGDKEFNSRLVAPTLFRNEPFDEYVEGLSHYWDGSCSFKIVFKKRGARVCRSSGVDATSFSSARWAVQIPSPDQAVVQRAG